MKTIIHLAAAVFLAAPAAAQTDLRCPDLKPKTRVVRLSRMQPLKRGKAWLEGTPKSVVATTCDLYGMKTEEAEYDGKNLLLKTSFVYKEKEEARGFCAALKSEESSPPFGEEAGAALSGLCREYQKKDFGLVLAYDASPSAGRETARKPVRLIFRFYDPRGKVTEERSYDQELALEAVTRYAYDKADNLIETAVKDFDGRQLRRETLAWDKATATRTRAVYGPSGELREKTVYEQREDGTLRREVLTSYDSGEQPLARTEFYSDEKSRREKELAYDPDAAEPKYEYTYLYKYDPKGNWTEERKTRVIVYNGNRIADTQYAPAITKRELMYY